MINMTTQQLSLKDTIISVVIVTLNDEDGIEKSLKAIDAELKLFKTHYEILVVDNNSVDKTVEIIKKLTHKLQHIRILVLSKQHTTEIALTAGLDNCVGDYAILFNIYTDPPKILPTLINKLLDGFDIVIGKSKQALILHSRLSKLFLRIVQRFSSHELYYRQSYLVGLSRKAINSITKTRRKSRNFGYIHYFIGFKKITILYDPIKTPKENARTEGFFELFFTVTDIIISNSFKPIRILTILGMFSSLLFLLYVSVIIILLVIFNLHIAPQGWITVSTVMGSLFFLLFSILTLMAEYIIRIVNESRNEPLYFVAEELDKSVILQKEDMLNVV